MNVCHREEIFCLYIYMVQPFFSVMGHVVRFCWVAAESIEFVLYLCVSSVRPKCYIMIFLTIIPVFDSIFLFILSVLTTYTD